MSVVIQVDRLSKQYRLGTIGGKRLVDDVNRWWARLRGREDPLSKVGTTGHGPRATGHATRNTENIWALKDVSFEVKQGEVLGIIGRNGAGKSTLLKILSRVTAPTSGEVRVKGRIASLLEVGTGFHPELTGRENIFLNGAILGMTRPEIRSKFDEIVAFSEVDRFINTPVKRYSSGMYVRLAFAVAAHLEPEILIVDEVLAVGDAEFQKKCIGKMKDVAGLGRTVLFVSHNLTAVRQLCTVGLLLQNGEAAMHAGANDVADRYLTNTLGSRRKAFRTNDTGYTEMRLVNSEGMPLMAVLPKQETFVQLGIRITHGTNVNAGFTIYNQMDIPLVLSASEYGGVELKHGERTFRVRLPTELLQPGTYRIEGAVWAGDQVLHKEDYLCHFQVMPARQYELQGRRSSAQFVSREPWIELPETYRPRTVTSSKGNSSGENQ